MWPLDTIATPFVALWNMIPSLTSRNPAPPPPVVDDPTEEEDDGIPAPPGPPPPLAPVVTCTGGSGPPNAEQLAKKAAEMLEQRDGGHSLDRHGPDVTDTALENRVTTGTAPDGADSATQWSTRFKNYQIWLQTRQAAMDAILKHHGLTATTDPGTGAQWLQGSVDFNRPIDEGCAGTPPPTVCRSVCPTCNTMFRSNAGFVNRCTTCPPGPGGLPPKTKKKGKEYPNTAPVSGLTRTQTGLKWDATQNRWAVGQHFPLGKDWDDTAKAYSTVATFNAAI